MEQCIALANAKINLSLDVVGKRADGYHLLQMVMQSVSLHDTVAMRKNEDGAIRLTCTAPEIPCDEQNIAHRSAALFLSHCGISAGVDIHIEKRIPSQAGLGGGSADGAAVFVGLNRLFQAGLSEQELCELGVQVGADVPFCVCGGARLCEGIGEIMTPLPTLPDCTILLCKPDLNINTGEAYRRIDDGAISARPDTAALCAGLAAGDLRQIGSHLRNVFESAIPLPVVEEIKAVMRQHKALGACMSGSGSTAFGLFDDPAAAEQCAQVLRRAFSEVYLTKPAAAGILFD